MDQEKHTDMDQTLEDLFQQAKEDRAEVSEHLLGAILADAQTQMPAPGLIAGTAMSQAESQTESWLRGLISGFGGSLGVSALAASACFGLWIGYAAPEMASLVGGDFAAIATETDIDIAFYSDLDDLWTEG